MKEPSETAALKQYRPLIKARSAAWARRFPSVDMDDLLQIASLAFIEAYRAWKPDAGSTLVSFAWVQIDRHISQYVGRERRRGLGGSRSRIELPPPQICEFEERDFAREADDVDAKIDNERLVSKMLCALSPRQTEILERVNREESYADIGRGMGISRERVRQIANEAYTRLRRIGNAA